MTINTILNAVSTTLAQQSSPVSVRAQAQAPSVAQTLPSSNTSPSYTSPSYTSPSQTVLQNASLLNASSNFAQIGSLIQVAQTGTEQVSTILQQLQSLSEQAASPENLGLDSEFQQLLSQLNDTAGGTTFGGASLLDGTFSGNTESPATATTSGNASAISSLNLPDLTTQGLFGGVSPNISTPTDAQNALSAVLTAQNSVNDASNQLSDVASQLNFATASISTALANSDAAASTLTESDLSDNTTQENISEFLNQPGNAAQAQTGNMPENLLSLLLG